MEQDKQGMCFRCEHRAKFLENGSRPRYECGEVDSTKFACYMYQPVKPIKLSKDENDPRPQFGGYMFTSRSHVSDTEPDLKAKLQEYKDGNVVYWVPDKKDKNIKKVNKKSVKKKSS